MVEPPTFRSNKAGSTLARPRVIRVPSSQRPEVTGAGRRVRPPRGAPVLLDQKVASWSSRRPLGLTSERSSCFVRPKGRRLDQLGHLLRKRWPSWSSRRPLGVTNTGEPSFHFCTWLGLKAASLSILEVDRRIGEQHSSRSTLAIVGRT